MSRSPTYPTGTTTRSSSTPTPSACRRHSPGSSRRCATARNSCSRRTAFPNRWPRDIPTARSSRKPHGWWPSAHGQGARYATVYQSRSGRPDDPWLGPDVCDHLREARARGSEAAVLSPIGFVCDHVEVLYDLDVEAAWRLRRDRVADGPRADGQRPPAVSRHDGGRRAARMQSLRTRAPARTGACAMRTIPTAGAMVMAALAIQIAMGPALSAQGAPARGLTARPGSQGRSPHADRTADRVHGRARREGRDRWRRRARQRARHARDRSARADSERRAGARHHARRRQRLRSRRGKRRDALPRSSGASVSSSAVQSCQSCRPPSCSTSASATDESARTPTAASRRRQAATDGPVAEGNVGAGAGATVGKMGGRDRAMKGGIGSAAITLPNGLVVAALVAVNARGDVVDPATGQVVAGMRTEDGKGLADVRAPPASPASSNCRCPSRCSTPPSASSPPTPR